MDKIAIIVAGGRGSRMGAEMPKQFLKIKDRPILMHTIERFFFFDQSIKLTVVLPEKQISLWQELCKEFQFDIEHEVVAGGETRFHSVKNGLATITSEQLVLIHDGVRPLVSKETIARCCNEAEKSGAVVPAMPVNESLRKVKSDSNKAVDRSTYVNVQTPQVFKTKVITEAYNQEFKNWFTDDASVVEANGNSISITDGNRENIKLTHPGDLQIAELLLANIEKSLK
ncbi:2-C-methyl-D-erythritol 4-phosphate cytidylyltransferase [Prolixibacteraceae bacterium JC049]|nr:2-C-methyl-D-erythritol 4-phosphate cytidylyltransferase [Prolixibacteraceae bacterium JC049]